jgi:drug/metabolite transporter (DMT)-like permease
MSSAKLYLLSILIWGSTWYAIKLQLDFVEPVVSVFYRFTIAGVVLLIWCVIRGLRMRYPIREHLSFLLLGLFLFSSNYVVFYTASQSITTGLVAVTFSSIIFFNMVGGAIFLNQKVTGNIVLGGLIGIGGLFLVFLPNVETFNIQGIALCFLGTLLASCGNITSAIAQRDTIPVVQANAWGMTYGSIFLLLYIVITDVTVEIDLSFHYLGALFYLAIFGSIVAFGSYLTLIGRVGPSKAAYATVLFPIVALIISTLFEDFLWTKSALLGVLFVLLGNLLVIKRKKVSTT